MKKDVLSLPRRGMTTYNSVPFSAYRSNGDPALRPLGSRSSHWGPEGSRSHGLLKEIKLLGKNLGLAAGDSF